MKTLLTLALAALLTACGGIPLRSVPQLVSLQGKLLDANPAEFMLAITIAELLKAADEPG